MPKRWGFLYPVEFGLIIVGIFTLVKQNLLPVPLILWSGLFAIPSSLAGEAHIWRMFNLLPLPQILAGIGLARLLKHGKYALLKLSTGFLVWFFLMRFLVDYFAFLPYYQGAYSYFGFRQVYQYLSGIEKDYSRIVIAPSGLGFEQLYIYYLFYLKPDPAAYQARTDVEQTVSAEKWVRVNRIGKWQFLANISHEIENLPDKTLAVVEGNFGKTGNLPEYKVLHTIDYANGDPAFKIIEINKK